MVQVDGLVALMDGKHIGHFNLGNPGEFTMLELAEVRLSALVFFLLPSSSGLEMDLRWRTSRVNSFAAV
jgi:hypothetical protein